VKKNQVGKSQLSPKSVLISPNRVIRVLIAAGFAPLPLCPFYIKLGTHR